MWVNHCYEPSTNLDSTPDVDVSGENSHLYPYMYNICIIYIYICTVYIYIYRWTFLTHFHAVFFITWTSQDGNSLDQDGNCGVLYERMARALVLCSSAGGTADMQQAAAQRRQTETRRLNKHITLWLFNIAMENGPFIDGLPIKNGDFP